MRGVASLTGVRGGGKREGGRSCWVLNVRGESADLRGPGGPDVSANVICA
jgi:hypothetical protein